MSSYKQGLDPTSLRTDAVLLNPKGTRCRVDRVANGHVYMTVLFRRTIDGQRELMVPVDEVAAHWTLYKAA